MGADLARAPLTVEAAVPATNPPATSSLTHRAVLTAIASLVDYGAQIATTLVVTPIVVSGLGSSLFGVWEMLRQAVGYMSAADGRPMDALRLVIASHQSNPDGGVVRRHVGASLLVWLLFLPVVAVAGTVLVLLAPTITKVGLDMRVPVQIACGLLLLTFVVGALSAIPEAVLRGMNLGYKRMGWQAALSVSGGLLTAGAVYAGLGVLGLGAAQLALALLTGICFLVLTRRFVPAFGIARPTKPEVTSLLRMSGWLTGGLVLTNMLLASDVLILGMVVSPAIVAMYVLTGAAPRMAVTLFNYTIGATTPGLGGLLGRRELDRAAHIRHELLTVTWLFVTVGGATILLWNRAFVSLWVGAEHFAGPWANVLIVCMMTQTAFIRGDAFIIDAALRPRRRVIVTAIAAALTLTATLALTPRFGILGLCAGILLGRLPQTIAYPRLAAACLDRRGSSSLAAGARQGTVMVAVFAGAAWLGQRVTVTDWFAWAGGAAMTVGVLLAIALIAGLPGDTRRAVIGRGLVMARTFRG